MIERRPVRMECTPSGDPTPDIVWTKDGGEPVGGHVRLLRGGRILQMRAAAVEDAGVYTCTATNVAGHDQKHYTLQVQGRCRGQVQGTVIG